jgi:hypothetical protein
MRSLTHRFAAAVGLWLLALSTIAAPADASSRFITRTAFGSGQVSTAPAFTTQPTIAATGASGGFPTYTATPGVVSNGSVTSRIWRLNGTPISTDLTAAPAASGILTYQEFASGTAGATASAMRSAVVSVTSALPATLTYALAGSSSPAQFFNTYGYSGTVSDVSQSSTDGTSFANSTQGAMVRTAANYIFNATGKKSRWIGKGVQGTTLYADPNNAWSTDTSALRASLVSSINAYTAANPSQPFTGVISQVGLNDFNDGNANAATVLTAYRKFISLTRSETGLPNLRFFILGTQDKPDAPKSVAAQRQAEVALASDPNVFLALQTNDAALNDSIHQNEVGQTQTGQRFGQFITAFVNGTTLPRGAQLLAATSVSNTSTRVTIKQVLGTDFTPTTGITGFLMQTAGGSSIAVSNAVRESATSILLTHASRYDTGATTVWYMPNGGQTTDDTATTVHDNSALALPMETSGFLTLSAITTPTTPSLSALTASNPAATTGTAYTGTISGTSSGSTLALSGAGAPGLTVSGTTVSGTPTTAGSVDITETLAGATNSPRTSSGVITVTAAAGGAYTATGKTAQISYAGNDVTQNPAGWNPRKGDEKAQTKTILTPAGVLTGWSDRVSVNVAAIQTSNNDAVMTGDGRYPDLVMRQYWYLNSSDTATIEYSGLDDTKFYDFEMSANRVASGDRTTEYIIGGVSKTVQVVNNYQTPTRFALFSKVKPVNGIVTLTYRNFGAVTFAYLGPVVIREFSGS